jgi:large subunit ribosomal protein L15
VAARAAGRRAAAVVCRAQAAPADGGERLRLHNLSPQDGSRRQNKRKGRGYGGHQGGTCGFGTRGQKSRAGSGTRPGFEGGQTALYRRLPKLRGICGGMPAGVADHVVVNLDDLEAHFAAGEEVTLGALVSKGVLHVSGADERLPLKVLGGGAVTKALTVKAASFSASAAEKIAAAGGSADVQAGRAKWTRRAYERAVAAAKEAGKDLVADRLKEKKAKKVAKAAAAAAGAKAKATA